MGYQKSINADNENVVDILIFMNNNDTVTTERLVQQFAFTPITAKRYLRQLTEFAFLESLGGNKSRLSFNR